MTVRKRRVVRRRGWRPPVGELVSSLEVLARCAGLVPSQVLAALMGACGRYGLDAFDWCPL
jgi:hypothetical protein